VALAEGRVRLQALMFTVLTGRVVLQELHYYYYYHHHHHYHHHLLSPLCSVFTNHGSRVYIVLQLFCIHNLCCM